MKLSEVTVAHDLMGHRRTLVKAFVEISSQRIGWDRRTYVFGFAVDEPMESALRVAARAEVRQRIEEADVMQSEMLVSLREAVERVVGPYPSPPPPVDKIAEAMGTRHPGVRPEAVHRQAWLNFLKSSTAKPAGKGMR